jgi:hypothetical protein
MQHLAQDGSRARFEQAREELAKVMLKGPEKRAADRKSYFEEQAGFAGVVTINQAEATYMDLNVHAFDELTASMVDWSDLKFGQAAIYKTREEYPIAVYVGNLAGGPPAVIFATAQNGAQVQPFQYFSKKFLVPNLVNAQFNLDAFKEKDKALARVARDMKLAKQQYVINTALNQPLSTSVATAITNYAALAAPWNGRTPYVLDPGVQSGSVVTTNVLNDSSEGGLTKNVFQSIVNYCRLAPDNLEGGALVPRGFFFSKVNTPWVSYWNQASIVGYSAVGSSNLDSTKAIPPSKWEEAVKMAFEDGGAYMNWFGTDIFCQPTNILPAGYGLLTTNKPWVLGWNQMDASVTDERDGDLGDRAFNNRYEARSICLAQPDPCAPNGAVVNYG